MRIIPLKKLATVDISNIDKKIKKGEKPVILCNFTDVYNNWAITSSLIPQMMSATANESQIKRFSLYKGQVALTKDSETRDDIGIAAYIADDIENGVLGYHCALITPNDKFLKGKYLNIVLHSPYAQKYFEANASGSGQRYTLTNSIIEGFPVPLPSIEIQDKFGEFCSNLDKKLENNNTICSSLEAVAKLLYDYWFVQFDFPDENGKPYKSSGGKMVWNEQLKREIPQGWSISKVSDYAEVITKGTTPTTIGSSFEKHGRIAFIKVENIENGEIKNNLSFISESTHEAMRRSQLKEDDILITIAGRLGSVCRVPKHILPANTNQAVGIVRLRNKGLSHFIERAMRSESSQYYYRNANAQSIQKNLNLPNVGNTQILCDDTLELAFLYSECIKPLIEMRNALSEENAYLLSLRDFLLPMLMNNQIKVQDKVI